MPQIIDVPNQGRVEFPDEMSDADIVSAIKKNAMSYPAKPGRVSASSNEDFQAGRRADSWKQGIVAGANGLLLGFGDEIGGAAGALVDKIKSPSSDLKDSYLSNRDTLRGMEDAQRERSPWTTGIAQALSSLPLTMAAPGARVSSMLPQAVRGAAAASPVTPGVVSRTLNAAGVGAATGAIAGAGNSTAGTLAGVMGDSSRAALTSAALSGAATPVASAVGAVARNATQRVSKTAAADFARQKVAEVLARDARGTLATGGYTNPLGQAAARFGRLGDEATVADAGGRNTNQLLDTLSTLPGRTKEAAYNLLRQRTAGVGDRMRRAADDALGTGGQRLSSTVESLINRREQASAPLYNQLRRMNIQPTQELSDIVRAADDLGATKIGREIATARQMPFTLDAAQPARWNMGDLDHVKQGIDQVLSSRKAMNQDGTMTPVGHAYQALKTRLVGALDQATTNPATGASLYSRARESFATPSGLIDAANAGRMALGRDESSITSSMRAMSNIELEAFRIGAYEGLRNKLGTQGGQTNIMNMWKEPATQEKLKAIFGDQRAYRQFAASVAKESALKRLQSVGSGSQTAARQAGMGDLDMSALTDAGVAFGAAKTGNLLSALGSAKNVWNRVATPQSVRDQMGNILLSRGLVGQQSLNGLAPLIDGINRRNLLLSNGTGLLGTQIGTNLANPAPWQVQQLP